MKITIIGGGWLGQPLAFSLQTHHQVLVTRRSREDCQALCQQGLNALPYCLGDDLNDKSLDPLFDAQLLILNIPPGRSPDPVHFQTFKQNMEELIAHAHKHAVDKIIFISTTAVYGEETRVVYEYSPVDPHTQSAKAHVALEHYCAQLFGEQSAVLRLAGLVGEDRHPVTHLAGRTELADPNKVVNLVHRDDVIQAISQIIALSKFGRTLHLSAMQHPNRKDYYQFAAKQKGLALPQFIGQTDRNTGKQVNPNLTLQTLEFELSYPDPTDMIATTN